MSNTLIPSTCLPMGTIIAFALPVESIPPGWLICDGSPIPLQYAELINALNSTFTPNLAGRTIIGTGTPNMGVQNDQRKPQFDPSISWSLGYTGGEYQHTLSEAELPAHSHDYTYQNPLGTEGGDYYSGSYWEPTTVNAKTAVVGENQAHFNMQPYQAFNYIIYTGVAE